MLQSEVEAMGDMFTRMNRQCYGKFFQVLVSNTIQLFVEIHLCIYAYVVCVLCMYVCICTHESTNMCGCIYELG
jgi:hypothetical protein